MFKAGSLVVHGGSGICRVESASMKPQPGGSELVMYYTLTPLFGSGTVYTPVDSKIALRPVLTGAEAKALLGCLPAIPAEDWEGRDQRFLTDRCKALLHSCRCEDLAALLKSARLRARRAAARGKKPGKIDQQYARRAEELLAQELALALEMTKDEAKAALAAALDAAGEG